MKKSKEEKLIDQMVEALMSRDLASDKFMDSVFEYYPQLSEGGRKALLARVLLAVDAFLAEGKRYALAA